MRDATADGMQDLQKLRRKLCRELAQSEHSAVVHPRREARRLGNTSPAQALRAIAEHADEIHPRLESLLEKRGGGSIRVGQIVGHLFSTLRHLVFDRVIDAERSYRGTLLGLHHGVDLTRLLREVALRESDTRLVRFCDEWLLDRLALIERAEQAMSWFAEQPGRAIRSGLRLALAK